MAILLGIGAYIFQMIKPQAVVSARNYVGSASKNISQSVSSVVDSTPIVGRRLAQAGRRGASRDCVVLSPRLASLSVAAKRNPRCVRPLTEMLFADVFSLSPRTRFQIKCRRGAHGDLSSVPAS